MPAIGDGGEDTELIPRIIQAFTGKKVIGAAAGIKHTAVWTNAGELFTFGNGIYGQLGHGGQQEELVPKLVSALTENQVIGAAAGGIHTAVWTEAGELFTFGHGYKGMLGHGGEEHELVPRLVETMIEA